MVKEYFLPFFSLFIVALTQARSVHGQAGTPQISLLDRNGKTITSVVDGNRVQLRIKLTAAVRAETKINFIFSDVTKSLAECTIKAGSVLVVRLLSTPLGWYWHSDGQRGASAYGQRASVNGSRPIGSLTVSVCRRPVVMVHEFNADYTTWTTYLGPQGYLAELGLQGFAVGDGQFPGLMETGNLKVPVLKRSKTIVQNAVILANILTACKKRPARRKWICSCIAWAV